jgi:2-oxoglutarate ferredoxin oxidoreductase subunit alpha
VIVPEKNNGQLVKLIREQFLIDAISYTKVQGLPFTQYDIVQQVKNLH